VSDYHIEKNRRQIVVRTRGGETVAGDMFLQAYGRYGGGAERPIDILNAAEHFFPLRVGNGDTVLIAKDQVVSVSCDVSGGDEDDFEEEITRKVAVEIGLINGESVKATVLLEVPDDHPRLLDFLNLRKMRFLSLGTDDGLLHVNRSMIERVRSLD
jgi:hypothetical protein